MINAALVGLGRWGQRLISSVQGKSDKIRFVAAVSRDPSRYAAFLSNQAINGFTSYDEVLASPEVDAVVLATPHSHHHRQILAAAAAKKHVWVEKPMTLRRDHAQEAVDALQSAGLTLAVGFTRRFLPAYDALMHAVESGALGEVLHIEGQQSGPAGLRPGRATSWRSDRNESPAGAMTGRGVHVLDIMIHIAGPVSAMAAISDRRVVEADMDDTAVMLLRHSGGATSYLGTINVTPNIWRVHVFGTKGHVEMRGENTLVSTDLDDISTTISFPAIDKERRGLDAFADAIEGRAPYPVTPQEAINNVAVLEQIEPSARAGAWVDIK